MYVLKDVIVVPNQYHTHELVFEQSKCNRSWCAIRAVHILLRCVYWIMPNEAVTRDLLDIIKIHSRPQNDIECGYTKKNI